MAKHSPISPKLPVLWHGGDYNPEQWSPEVWAEDIRLMDEAGVNVATVGVFSWVSLEPSEGEYTFEWLDQIMDLLAKNGKVAVLATPSAAPPAWMSKKYPEILRVDADGVRRRHGNRVNYNWASPIYQEKVQGIARVLANRYAKHPALAMWHVSNEYGGEDYSDQSRDAFVAWLKVRYENDLDRLNKAYWSAFWGHTYTDWDQIEIPGVPYGESSIHGQNLDWKRFSSDRIIEFFRHESAPLREITPEIPITTNLMGLYPVIDCAKIAPYVDVMTWDSYPAFNGRPSETEMWVNIAFIHDLYRSFKQKPFLLIESTPSSSNWYPVMQLKRPGTHELEAMQAIAHGSEGVMYFQWRQSRGSQEKFHGAVVGHGTENRSRVFKEVAKVGHELPKLNELVGVSDPSEVAVIYDWENRWAVDDAVGPILKGKNYPQTCTDHYRAFWEMGIPVDVIDSTRGLSTYKVVVAPMLYMLKPGVAESLAAFVENGGTLVSTYYTGYVNESDLVFEDGYLAPLRHVFGIEVEEIDAFYPDEAFAINGFDRKFHGHTLCEIVHPKGAEVLATVSEVFYAGSPALTRNVFGQGQAYYVAGRADENFTHALIERIVNELNIRKVIETPLPKGVTAQRRGDRVFIMNCTPHPQDVGGLELPPYGVSIR